MDRKYNTLIILTVLSGLVTIFLTGIGTHHIIALFTRQNEILLSAPEIYAVSLLFGVFAYIFPAIWIFKNPPYSVNKWTSLFLVLIFKLGGILAYLLLVVIEYFHKIKTQDAEPVE